MKSKKKSIYYILFTGHMIDRPERLEPRFPPIKELGVREKIREALELLKADVILNKEQEFKAIAGGACGGDIIFHEQCIELGIPSVVYLALSPDKFKKESVSFAGKEWDERFDRLIKRLPFHVLANGKREVDDPTIWEDTNEWMVKETLSLGEENIHLIALWDGKKGDGNGGAEHMVKNVRKKHGAIQCIDINTIN